MTRYQKFFSHALYWGVWFVLWALVMGVAALQGDVSGAFRQVTPSMLIMALTVKLAFVINDRLQVQYQKAISLVALIGISASFNIWHNFFSSGKDSAQPLEVVVAQEIINASLMMGVAFALRYGMNSIKAKHITEKAELLRKLAEQRALNARLTPHVLYNMLNTIYSASLKEPHKASKLILALASMMRHLTDSTDKDFVDAEMELNFMRHYAELTRMQLHNDRAISLDFPEEVDCQIPNLLCVTLFENAITHGKSQSSAPEIHAEFVATEAGFIFRITNSMQGNTADIRDSHIQKNNIQENKDKSSDGKDTHNKQPISHTGIESVRERLAYLYPGCHRFQAGPVDGNKFHAEIETW